MSADVWMKIMFLIFGSIEATNARVTKKKKIISSIKVEASCNKYVWIFIHIYLFMFNTVKIRKIVDA
jgi:hypothetical protein